MNIASAKAAINKMEKVICLIERIITNGWWFKYKYQFTITETIWMK
jgi:hypothetical protein